MVSTPKNTVIPEADAVSSETGFSGPKAKPRDASPEKNYKPAPGDSNNMKGKDAPGGPVNIPVKGGG